MLHEDVTTERGHLSDRREGLSVLGRPVLLRSDDRGPAPQWSDSLRRPEVVVGVHCAEEIRALVPVATREAATRGAPLCVFTAGRTEADRLVESALLDVMDVAWRLVRTMGERPSAALLRYVEPEDLLVLGVSGPLQLAGLAAGSVNRAVVDAMPCDVLLVPMPPTRSTTQGEEGTT